MNDNPFVRPATDFTVISPLKHQESGGYRVIVLDRVVDGFEPEYCIHGRVQCFGCNHWCFLGDKSHDIVREGQTVPLCLECATEKLPHSGMAIGHAADHRRADGPH